MNSQELYKTLFKAYTDTELPTALFLNEKFETNAAFKNQFGVLDSKKVTAFLEELSECSGVCHKLFNNKFYSVNVIHIADVTVIEFTDVQTFEKLVNTASVRRYLVYIFSKIHLSVNSIASAASELMLMNKYADEKVNSRIASIDSSLMKIAETLVDPEQLVYLTNSEADDSTISLKDETERFVKDLRQKFGRHIRIECSANDLIYVHINRNTLRTLLADTIMQLRRRGSALNSIIISSEIISDSAAQITIESVYEAGTPCQSSETEEEIFAANMFFDYICTAFCNRYNASFQQQETPGGYKFVITFPTLRACSISLCTPSPFKDPINRFDVVNLRFADFKNE